MSRTAGSDGVRTEGEIRKAAIELIATHGFEAMTMRQLAEKVGIQPGSVYRYFPSKGKLLAQLQVEHLDFLLGKWAEESTAVASAPIARLKAFVDFHIRYHTLRRQEVFVANMELRSLEPEDYRNVVALRRRYEKILQGILAEGVAQGLFHIRPGVQSAARGHHDIVVTSFAILAMLTGVGTWFNESGRMAKQDLIDLYTQLVFQSLGLKGKTSAKSPSSSKPASPGARLEHAHLQT